MENQKKASQDQSMELCRQLYKELSPKGFFPALTGGSLYKTGLRKDIDVVIYRHRQKANDFELEILRILGLLLSANGGGLWWIYLIPKRRPYQNRIMKQ